MPQEEAKGGSSWAPVFTLREWPLTAFSETDEDPLKAPETHLSHLQNFTGVTGDRPVQADQQDEAVTARSGNQLSYPLLALTLTRSIRWDIIENNYDLTLKSAFV